MRREETLGIHVDLEILGTLARQVHVEDDGLFADAAFPLVPLVVLRGVGLLVEPHVEIGAQEALVGGLAHVFLQVLGRNALLARRRAVRLDGDLLQEIFAVGNTARDAARRACKAQQHDQSYTPHPKHAPTD